MKLAQLFEGIPNCHMIGPANVSIRGLCLSSKEVKPGYLFIARQGTQDNGTRYIPEAIAAGAAAVLTLYPFEDSRLTTVIHPNPAAIEEQLAKRFYQDPSSSLWMVGITGTNGKTTTTFAVKHLLDRLRGPCGLIGTIEYIVGKKHYPASRTTPDLMTNYQLLKEMVDEGCQSAVMEVTSHGLDQGRVLGIDYDVAVFSNLTTDHLDYHHTMEHYCQAKNQLFRHLGSHSKNKLRSKTAVVNADSPWVEAIIAGCEARLLTYGIDKPADLYATEIQLKGQATELTLHYRGQTKFASWPLIGRFNVYNGLSAVAVGLACGFSLEDVIEAMRSIPPVPGRLEPIKNELGLHIYVDFAHTGDALANVLQTLTELKKKRLIAVFGCGGDRDHNRRVQMAEASERYADISIVTSDNPRSEDPNAICQEIAQHFSMPSHVIIEVDRRLAIQKALEMAEPEDIILIAGKGHEPYQIFANQTLPFDDREVAAELCKQLYQLNRV